MFDYTETLHENKDFKRLYYRGKYKAHPLLVTYLMKSGKQNRHKCRVGITSSKKIGGAVERNRARRVIRAAYREAEKQFDLRGYDMVFVARGATGAAKSTDVLRVMKKQLFTLLNPSPQQNPGKGSQNKGQQNKCPQKLDRQGNQNGQNPGRQGKQESQKPEKQTRQNPEPDQGKMR